MIALCESMCYLKALMKIKFLLVLLLTSYENKYIRLINLRTNCSALLLPPPMKSTYPIFFLNQSVANLHVTSNKIKYTDGILLSIISHIIIWSMTILIFYFSPNILNDCLCTDVPENIFKPCLSFDFLNTNVTKEFPRSIALVLNNKWCVSPNKTIAWDVGDAVVRQKCRIHGGPIYPLPARPIYILSADVVFRVIKQRCIIIWKAEW